MNSMLVNAKLSSATTVGLISKMQSVRKPCITIIGNEFTIGWFQCISLMSGVYDCADYELIVSSHMTCIRMSSNLRLVLSVCLQSLNSKA